MEKLKIEKGSVIETLLIPLYGKKRLMSSIPKYLPMMNMKRFSLR